MGTTSFLPEDYLDQKAERRTNIISLTLFAIVMVAVFSAFLVTNRQWTQIKTDQEEINAQYREAAEQIERLSELEEQKDQVLGKAELAAALIERVPRSILLAELVNRMPAGLGLLAFELRSEQITARKAKARPSKSVGRLRGPSRARTRQEAAEKPPTKRIEAPRFRIDITMVGVAPTDLEVSQYMAQLSAHPLFDNVRLEYSEEREFEGRRMRKFEVKMVIAPGADVREVARRRERIKDPTPRGGKTASVRESGRRGG